MLRARLAVAVLAAVLSSACSSGGGGGGGGGDGNGGQLPPPPGPVATAKGTVLEPGASADVTPAGGTFSSSDGRLRLTVPAGALVDPHTLVTIQRITPTAPGARGAAYRLLPDGLTFASPVTLTFDATGLATAGVGSFGVAWQDASRRWNWLRQPARDEGAQTVSVTTTHFTDFSGVSSILLQPLSATVPTNGSVSVHVEACYEPDVVGSLAPLQAWSCGALAPLVEVDPSSWAVNGVAGGNATFGTVTGNGLSATYHAPAIAPTPSTVAVTVRTVASAGRPQATLFSLVTVGRPGPFHGSLQASGTFIGGLLPMTVTIPDATLTVHDFGGGNYDDGPDETNYDFTGTVTAPASVTAGNVTCTITDTTHPLTNTSVKVLKDPPGMRFGFVASFPATCSFGATSLIVNWSTTCLAGFVDVPIPDTQHLEGSYTTSCLGSNATATWSFLP